MDRPNFVFIITDQHRADWLGCMGHPVVKTPNIDAIAAQGTMFTDFHVASPVCMPNRASLMTGRMPNMHGVRYNGCHFDPKSRTFADVLRASGYDTALIGKSHLQPFTTSPPVRAAADAEVPPPLVDEALAPDGADYGHEQPDRYETPEDYVFPENYYGFGHVRMATGHGVRAGGHYLQWLRRTVPDWEEMTDPQHEIPHNYTCPQSERTALPEQLYPTTWVGNEAVSYINGRAPQDAPFFAFVSFPDPHHPFNPPGDYWDMYAPDQFDVDLPYEAHQNPTPAMQNMRRQFEAGIAPRVKQAAAQFEAQHIREAMALTAGMITMVDDQVGRIVQALKDSGQYDNTVIVFTSDHGDYMGDFNMLLKGPMHFRSITRVPMIWSDPADRAARVSPALASTIDVPASILARVGLTPYNGMQGSSFLPALSGGDHRPSVYIEHNDGGPRCGFEAAARARSVITSTHRMTCYGGLDWGELYDLKADPNETLNLWDAPEAAEVKARLSLELIGHMALQMDESRLSERLA